MDEHVHCAVCHAAIATQRLLGDGTIADVEVRMVARPQIQIRGGQVGFVPEAQPACETCWQAVQQAQRDVASRIVVAQAGAVGGMRH